MSPVPPTPIPDLFWPKIDKSGDCWEWLGVKVRGGYGRIGSRGRTLQAHRVAYELCVGPIPEGLVIDHMCHNPSCVNPEHLRAVTQKQNLENQSGAYSTSKSGIRGVSWSKNAKKWVGFVQHNKKNIYAGTFDDIEDAENAVIALRNKLFTHNDADRRAA